MRINMAIEKNSNPGKEWKKPTIETLGTLREIKADKIVSTYTWWSMASGLIPFLLLDTLVSSAIQLKMLASLSKFYQVPFSRNIGKFAISTLMGYATANFLRFSFLTSIWRALPIVGFLGYASMPIYSGAITYAIGKIFIQHFESGGTFLNFKPYKVKKHFLELCKEGRTAAYNLQAEKLSR